MGFTSGSVTFTRYQILGAKPRQFHDEHLNRLAEHARPNLVSADGVGVGWGAGEHCQDRRFCEEKNVYPDHLLWDLWVETQKIPPERLQTYYAIELKGAKHPDPRQKRLARHAARERLAQEASDGRWVRWATIPCVWDLVRNEVLVGTTSAAQLARFEGLFATTFQANLLQHTALAGELLPVNAGRLAVAMSPTTARDTQLSEFVERATPCERPVWVTDDRDSAYLGNEFAVWLWHQLETGDDTVRLPDGSDAVVMLSGGMKLDCPAGYTGNDTLNHDGPARMPEAWAGLRTGKLPRKIGLTVVSKGEQFALHLQCETFAVSSAKLPPADATPVERRDVIVHRLQACRDLCEVLEGLYSTFLTVRLSSAWGDELARIRAWVSRTPKAVKE